MEGEDIEVRFLPAREQETGCYEIEVKGPGSFGCRFEHQRVAHWLRKGDLAPGTYRIRVRWTPTGGRKDRWTEWSTALVLTVHEKAKAAEVERLKVAEHRLSLMLERDVHGVATITDPWMLPPGCPDGETVRWFRTPCYDGSGILVNEEADYYRDPYSYYLECIEVLRDRNARFITWHDVIEGRSGVDDIEVILQFDLDAGPRSMARIYEALAGLDVRATVMVHREAHDWYEYRIEDVCLNTLVEAEHSGWAIGYHNNALGNAQRIARIGDHGPEVTFEASKRFRMDVETLRAWFDIRTFTHHGGVVVNKRTEVPSNLALTCVDRPFNPGLWKPVHGSFSDGGFLSRPMTLRERVRSLRRGLYFFRNHPVKYANYRAPFDVPPLVPDDAVRAGADVTEELHRRIEQAIDKQALWLQLRDEYRLKRRLSYASIDKPISRRFKPFEDIAKTVETFRTRRRGSFLRQYPWVLGDPRVFWWRMLHTYSPSRGDILNVGALPLDQRNENTAFLSTGVNVFEMDVDGRRSPHILCDVGDAPEEWNSRFASVLLLGLPYFPAPSRAAAACLRLTADGGIGLFGFAADTHPLRGALWRPADRPLWRPDDEPLRDAALRSRLWSFDREGLNKLFVGWEHVAVEFFSHYWFVVAQKATE
ncbi:MAG: hypothetical protein ACREPG_10305 [Candidatus Binatia bacterium]